MSINAVIAQFELQTNWYLNEINNISELQSNIQFNAHLNPIKWVAGHLVNSRITILNILINHPINERYKTLFGKGSSNKLDDSFPMIEKITEDWIKVSSDLKIALHEASEEQLLSQPPFQTSIPDKTLLGLLAFFAVHEAHHLGQISILKRLR